MSHLDYSKKCKICKKILTTKNKSGFCNKHRDRTGKNNPFYGKKHSKETVEKIKAKTKIKSINLWKNEEYRDKVIKAVSKPRKESFKQEQSTRIKQWYMDNPQQKIIRSQAMKKSWEDNKIVKSPIFHMNISKLQKEITQELRNILSTDEIKTKTTIRIGDKWFFPDIMYNSIIIEVYGNYWHANPNIYKENDLIKHEYAKDIWTRNKNRIIELEDNGYKVLVIWEQDWKDNKQAVLSDFDELLNWESCAF
jgi:G:T-mismatch repair DNA endonuclease (very short patch repair protein)